MNEFLFYLSSVIMAISALLGMIIGPRQSFRPYKWLMVYLIVTLINTVALGITGKMGIRNHFIANIYQYLRFPLLAWIYLLLFEWQNQKKANFLPVLLWIITPPFFVYCLIELGINKLHTPYVLAGSVFIILSILVFFYTMFTSEVELSPFVYPFFWTSLGLFFFFLLLMISRGIMTTLIANIQLAKVVSIVLNSYNCILYSLIGVDFLIAWKQTRKSASLSLQ
jgi:hypothetical protein